MRESKVESYLCERAIALGGEVRKVKWLGHRGAPDRLVLVPAYVVDIYGRRARGAGTGSHTVPARRAFVELKRPKAAPESHQVREHARLRSYGFDVLVIDSIEGVDHHFPLT